MMNKMECADTNPRLYNLAPENMHFQTGRRDDGTQILFGIQGPELVSLEFDAGGNHLRTSVERLGTRDKNEHLGYIRDYQQEIGFIPGMITVKQFSLPERYIGIRELPDHYQDVLDYPEYYDEERRQMLLEDIRLWREKGEFVLDWDEDYYFAQDGTLSSS